LNLLYYFIFKETRRKRSLNGQPVQLYVETLPVLDQSLYLAHQGYSGSTDQNIVFQHMKIYFSHVFNQVFIFYYQIYRYGKFFFY